MQREGYSKATITERAKALRNIARQLGTLLDGDAVKDLVARVERKPNTKLFWVKTYKAYAVWKGYTWEKPIVQNTGIILPFIPLESELDSLIAGSRKKLSAFLQTLKESGARAGEVARSQWTDLDNVNSTLIIRPEKGSNPRQSRITQKLLAMLLALPRKNSYLFGGTSVSSLGSSFHCTRRTVANKIQNPRLLRIHFHTFRHWKATATYHKTKDLLYTKSVLGHKSLSSTLVYTQLVNWETETDYLCRFTKSLTEASTLIEGGWEFVTDMDEGKLFRKRK
jgi:integrase